MSKNVLAQHVLGVMVHANPKNKVYLFTFNDSVPSGANNNIEGIRRTLCAEFAGRCLPRTLYIQADNASDNKCWTVLLFLGMLVYHNYTADIYFSFLLVGHTHEDIDSLFAVISRHFRSIPNHSIAGKTPQSFQEEMDASLTEKFLAVCTAMEWVLDWDAHLKPHRHPGTTGIGHVDIEAEPDEGARAPHQFWIHRRASDGAVGVCPHSAAHTCGTHAPAPHPTRARPMPLPHPPYNSAHPWCLSLPLQGALCPHGVAAVHRPGCDTTRHEPGGHRAI